MAADFFLLFFFLPTSAFYLCLCLCRNHWSSFSSPDTQFWVVCLVCLVRMAALLCHTRIVSRVRAVSCNTPLDGFPPCLPLLLLLLELFLLCPGHRPPSLIIPPPQKKIFLKKNTNSQLTVTSPLPPHPHPRCCRNFQRTTCRCQQPNLGPKCTLPGVSFLLIIYRRIPVTSSDAFRDASARVGICLIITSS